MSVTTHLSSSLRPSAFSAVKSSVLVIGGGLAGLSAAAALAPRGFRVTVLESRQRLGGRAGSFADAASGQLIDACQHVSMGCCTNFAHFCETVGIGHLLAPQPTLYFVTPDRRVSRFKADPWPAPFHLGRALASAHYLTAREKARVGWGLAAMLREPPDADPPLSEWLPRHRQTRRTIDRFWGVVLTSALNETVERAGFKYARMVFRDGFLRHRDGFVVRVPTVPLGRLYGDELRGWLTRHGVEVRENAAVRRLEMTNDRMTNDETGNGSSSFVIRHSVISRVVLRDGSALSADYYVLAVPFDRVMDLLPDEWAADPYFAAAKNLAPSPITSVHLWYDRPALKLPHAVLVDCLGQWVFNRGEVAPGEWYVQVVVSAARPLRGLGRDEITRRVADELARLFPNRATHLRSRVVTEHAATFSAVPGVDRFRPPQASPVPNLVLAGDWTATGWPATMEGAVRSGYLAAEAVLARAGRPERLLRPELGDG
jgi:squalene-associated FAD-dependent desaturase